MAAASPDGCPVHRAFRNLAGPFGCGKWANRNALYLHCTFQCSGCCLTISHWSLPKPQKSWQGVGEGSLFHNRSRRDYATATFGFPSRHCACSLGPALSRAIFGTQPAGWSDPFRNPYLTLSCQREPWLCRGPGRRACRLRQSCHIASRSTPPSYFPFSPAFSLTTR